MPPDLSPNPPLHHERIQAPDADPERWMMVLHGIYGAGRNWVSVARRFVQARPDWGALLVDLREHGRSQGFTPPHTVDACADDLRRLVATLGLDTPAILGHSFGGKVALRYAARSQSDHTAPRLECAWIIDSTPAARPPDGSVWAILRVLRIHPGPFRDRAEGMAAVEAEGFSTPVAQWMSTNLVRTEGGELIWRLDPDVMEALLRDFFALDAWGVVDDPPAGCEIHIVRARESPVMDADARRGIEAATRRTEEASGSALRGAGRVHLWEVAGGHWLHADNPDALHELLVTHTP